MPWLLYLVLFSELRSSTQVKIKGINDCHANNVRVFIQERPSLQTGKRTSSDWRERYRNPPTKMKSMQRVLLQCLKQPSSACRLSSASPVLKGEFHLQWESFLSFFNQSTDCICIKIPKCGVFRILPTRCEDPPWSNAAFLRLHLVKIVFEILK